LQRKRTLRSTGEILIRLARDFELTLHIDGNAVHSLRELNIALSNWRATTYHLRVHKELRPVHAACAKIPKL